MRQSVSFLLLLIIAISGISAQTTEVNVNCWQAGKLKKCIDKKDYESIKSLKISGEVDRDDIKFITKKLVNLEVLDMTNVDYTLYSVPVLPNLRILLLPKGQESDNSYDGVHISDCIKQNTNLEILGLAGKIAEKVDKMPNLKTIVLYSGSSRKEKDGIPIDTIVTMEQYYDATYHSFYDRRYSGETYAGYRPRYVKYSDGTIFLNSFDPERTDFSKINYLPDLGDSQFVKTPDELDLSDVYRIGEGYFKNSSISRITFSKNIYFIRQGAFSGCENLTELDFPNEGKLIARNITNDYSHLKKIHFHGPTYFGTWVGDVAGEDCVIEFDSAAMINLDGVRGKFHHIVLNNNNGVTGNFLHIVLDNELGNHLGKDIMSHVKYIEVPTAEYADKLQSELSTPHVYVKGKGFKSYNITVEQPGTILSYLPSNDLAYIDSLTIKGVLYETDLKVIDKCHRLVYLDLGKVIIKKSPEKAREEKENREFYQALFGMLSAGADAMYGNYEMGTGDYMYAKVMAELGKEAASVSSSVENCNITNMFDNKLFLQKLILPYRGYYIGYAFNNCPELEYVQLPVKVKALKESFNNCPKLKDLDFPGSLVFISGFNECHSLEVVDLRKMKFEPYDSRDSRVQWRKAFVGCANLREIWIPEGIEELYPLQFRGFSRYDNGKHKDFIVKVHFPKTLKGEVNLNYFDNTELHFQTAEPPCRYYYGRNMGIGQPNEGCHVTLYCPKGSTTAYFNATDGSKRVTIIEE